MKIKVKNIKTKVVKEIDSKLLDSYLATKEWEKAENEKKSSFAVKETDKENKDEK